jgi:hypothetical protein
VIDSALEEFLAEIEVDFPLDEGEVEPLNNVFDLTQPLGTLTLTTAYGTDWEADYTE